jgi:hypothetical protein
MGLASGGKKYDDSALISWKSTKTCGFHSRYAAMRAWVSRWDIQVQSRFMSIM